MQDLLKQYPLSAEMQQAFLAKAAAFGHDKGSLLAGEEIITRFHIPTPEQGALLFCNAADAEKVLRHERFFNPVIQSRSRLGQGVHDRGEAYVFAGGPKPVEDLPDTMRHFPACAKATSVLVKVIERDEVWDLSQHYGDWGLGPRDDLYTALNVGLLVIEPGGQLQIRGNILSLLCQRIVLMDHNSWHVGILPTPWSADNGHGPQDGEAGEAGQDGLDGSDGIPLVTASGFIGLLAAPGSNVEDMNGKPGGDGGRGGAGGKGRNGGVCKLAELVFRDVEGSLVIHSQAGPGGDGGSGGAGGKGGKGGAGAPGLQLLTGWVPDGAGGDGGKGGEGGAGGNAGHGGISSNIYITVPPEQIDRVYAMSTDSEGGKAGAGGPGGQGGEGGKQGQPAGEDGTSGKAGLKGRARAGAVIYINEEIQTQQHLQSIVI